MARSSFPLLRGRYEKSRILEEDTVQLMHKTHFAHHPKLLVGTLNLVFIIGLPLSLWLYGAWKLAYRVPAFAIAFLSLPPIATVLTLGLAVFTVLGWKNKYWSVIARAHYSLITLAALAFIPFLTYWNLLGFQF